MAKQVAQGGLMAALGEAGKKAVAEAKTKETKYPGGGRLPPGIEGGVAQLTKCYFTQYKDGDLKGKFYFRCEAVMIKPDVHDGVPVRGMHTSYMEPACATPNQTRKTVAEHLEVIVNQMAILGVDRTQLADDGSDLEATAAALQDAQPFFQVRTWKGDKQELVKGSDGKYYVTAGKKRKGPYATEKAATDANPYVGKEPRVNEVWGKVLPDYVPEEGEVFTDDTAAAPEAEEAVSTEEVAAEETATEEVATEGEGEEVTTEGEGGEDLDALAAAADAKDKEAKAKMISLAKEAGLTDDQIKKADDWAEVAGLIREATGGGGEGEIVEEEWKPEVGNALKFHPLGANKKPVKKAVDVEVKEVDEDAKTVTLKNLDDNKTIYKKVAWDRLVHD